MKNSLIFDFGQTIADSANGFRSAERDAQAKIFSFLGIKQFNDFLSTYRWVRNSFHERSEFSRKAMWTQVIRRLGGNPDESFLDEIEDEYWNTVEAQTKLFPEALTVLEKLRLNFSLAMITNTQGQRSSGRHRSGRFAGLDGLFHTIIVAGESGIPPKPDGYPFMLCLEKLGVSAEEAVFVGDDWRIDVCGARNAGIQPIWIKHRSVERSWPDGDTSVPVITSLDCLLDLNNLIGE